MNVVRYEPWNVFEKFSKDLNALLDNRSLNSANQSDDSNVVTSRWAPAVDIKEEADKFVLLADIPGVDPKDIEITMDQNVLSIKGERSYQHKEESNGFKRVERAHGAFYRRFSLPDTADSEQISATGDHGVLTITIPKKEKAMPRKIAVNS